MDSIDIQIVNILQENSRTSIKQISEKVMLSAPSVKERINKMTASGLIREFTTVLEPAMMGKTLTAFMFLTLKRPDENQKFLDFINDEPEILACHYLTGDFDYMVQIVTSNSKRLEELLSKVKLTHEVARTRTVIALSTIKEKHSVTP
ncbi:MAG: Lrp/AsnC family transcriptional regulator [Clostridia bacterium]|nr:Lrp/AsnC family transcriptional regulator [Clostridia bacterium]